MTHLDRIIITKQSGIAAWFFFARYEAIAERQYSPGGRWCYIPPMCWAPTVKQAEKAIIRAIEKYDRGNESKVVLTKELR